MKSTEFDSHAFTELTLYVENSEHLIRQAYLALGRFYKKGQFSYDRGLAYISRYIVATGAKEYNLQYGSMTQPWHKQFPKALRDSVSESLLNGIIAEFRLGNFW